MQKPEIEKPNEFQIEQQIFNIVYVCKSDGTVIATGCNIIAKYKTRMCLKFR